MLLLMATASCSSTGSNNPAAVANAKNHHSEAACSDTTAESDPFEQKEKRLNVVLFHVDDLGWQDTSVPFHSSKTLLNERYRTPHMERLASRGVRFTNSYASAPVCTPTRTSLLTGQSPGRTHITYWTLHKDTDTSRPHPVLQPPPWNMNGLDDQDVTLPKLLQAAGYQTIHVGKAHFGAHGTSGGDPRNLGFDVNIAGHASGGPASYYGEQHFSLAGRKGQNPAAPDAEKSVWDIPGIEAYHGSEIYLTEALAIEACRAIEDAVEAGKPFFINFAPYAVHAPIMANEKLLAHYLDLDSKEAAYATMIETMDAALGSIVEQLKSLDVEDRTVIVFSSDNGGLSAHARGAAPDGQKTHTHNAPLKSGKGSAYEGGTRVPTMIAWPGITDESRKCHTPIITHDLFPTILTMTGVELPEEYAHHVEGRDLTALLKGTDGFDDERPLFWHQPHQWGAAGPGIFPFTSIRQGDWKLIYFHADRSFELYNLAEDIGEMKNLAADQTDTVLRLTSRLDQWIQEAGAQLSIDKSTGRPIEMPGEAASRWIRSALNREGDDPDQEAMTVPETKESQFMATVTPIPSQENRATAAGWLKGGTWLDQHEDIVRIAKEHDADLVFLGDSITQSWGGAWRSVGSPGNAIWDASFSKFRPVNQGISGDRTQHLLWRIDHGCLDHVDPKLIVMMIGTNNLAHDDPDDIVAGIETLADKITKLKPKTTLLLVSIVRGKSEADPLRRKAEAVNEKIRLLDEHPRIRFIDLRDQFYLPDQSANSDLMRPDFIHFSQAGYQAWADALLPHVERISDDS